MITTFGVTTFAGRPLAFPGYHPDGVIAIHPQSFVHEIVSGAVDCVHCASQARRSVVRVNALFQNGEAGTFEKPAEDGRSEMR